MTKTPENDEALRQRLAAALAALTELGVQPSQVERLIGVSRGYLGSCLPTSATRRTPSRPLVYLLEVLVRHPTDFDLLAP